MTDARTTQIALEQWGQGAPAAQVTQIAMEQWVVPPPPSVQLTMIALEMWASVGTAGLFSARHI